MAVTFAAVMVVADVLEMQVASMIWCVVPWLPERVPPQVIVPDVAEAAFHVPKIILAPPRFFWPVIT